ncbi:MAG TPA: prepilin-type N-terminal cleavage/methylation domain-containing protein, partial [Planctomicrobium sp.]|nr:prepilin-type N-terminal cleavage/methylation domain-containing protein [Planctomicrobium sp.]
MRRSAFTLVELLVAMGIFVILASLAVTGYQSTYNMDQVGQAASTVRASLEGARSRAIKAKGRRGLRLLLDPQDRRIVTSLAYVSPPETVTGYLRLEFDNRQPADDPPPEDSPSFGR